MIDAYGISMLPVTHILGQADPFDRFCNGSNGLNDSYRKVVNTGVWVYQLHAYHALAGLYFGKEVQNTVRDYQLAIFAAQEGARQAIRSAMQMIDGALDVKEVCVETEVGEICMPVELNVSLALLLHDPASPDYVKKSSQREDHVSRLGKSVEWSLARCLASGRDEIVSIFSPILAQLKLDSEGLGGSCSPCADSGERSGR